MDDVVLNILEREFAHRDGGEALDPLRDGDLLDSDVSCHGEPPIHAPEKRRQSNPVEAGIAKEL